MLFEKYSNPEQMSISENDIGDTIFKNNLENTNEEKDGENINQKKPSENALKPDEKINLNKKTKSKSSFKSLFNDIFPFKIHELPVEETDLRLIDEKNLPMKKQLQLLVTDLDQLNLELEKNCGIKHGFANFLECQSDFTQEILDAYITSIDLTKNDLNQYFSHQDVEQKRAFHNLGKSINMPKNFDKNEVQEDLEDYENEVEISNTQLEWTVPPENIPLPQDKDEQEPRKKPPARKDHVFLETVADIHATLVGDQKKSVEPENVSLASSSIKDAGEYKVQRPVPDPQPLDKSLDAIEDVIEPKTKRTMRSKFRSFFARTQNRNHCNHYASEY